MKIKKNTGFTLIELIVVIAILSALIAIVVPNFFSFKKNLDLDDSVRGFVSVLKLAQNKTLSSEGYNAQYGVYLNTGVSPNQYTLFKGATYSLNPSSYQVYSLQNTMEFYDISLGGGNEIVFDRLTGASENSGNISIRIKTDTNQNETVYVASSGTVSFSSSAAPSDINRVEDSRHIQFSYSRTIDAANENITLIFDNSKTEIIPISSFLVSGELQWQGTVNVGGTDQIVEINTHRLNSPDTLFSIRRDRRYNNKTLKVVISGDTTGSLAEYLADGSAATFSSAYVSDFNQQ